MPGIRKNPGHFSRLDQTGVAHSLRRHRKGWVSARPRNSATSASSHCFRPSKLGYTLSPAPGGPQMRIHQKTFRSPSDVLSVFHAHPGAFCAVVPRFAFVANTSDNTVSIYTVIASSGLLRDNGYVLVGTKPVAVTVTPNGQFLYVANSGSSNVSAFSVNLDQRRSDARSRFSIYLENRTLRPGRRSRRKIPLRSQ